MPQGTMAAHLQTFNAALPGAVANSAVGNTARLKFRVDRKGRLVVKITNVSAVPVRYTLYASADDSTYYALAAAYVAATPAYNNLVAVTDIDLVAGASVDHAILLNDQNKFLKLVGTGGGNVEVQITGPAVLEPMVF